MGVYSEVEKSKDFAFLKNINKDFFDKNVHKFLAIKNPCPIRANLRLSVSKNF